MAKLDIVLDDANEEVIAPINTNVRKRIKDIELSLIDINKLNLFNSEDTKEEIEEFAYEIYEDGGIKIPISVYENEGRYILLGGERRYRAYKFLLNKFDYSKTIPAIIEEDLTNQKEKELDMIILLNKQREMKEKTKLELVFTNIERYVKLKEEGKKPNSDKRNWVANNSSVSMRYAQDVIAKYDEGLSVKDILNLKNSKETEKEEKPKPEYTFKKFYKDLDKIFYQLDEKAGSLDLTDTDREVVDRIMKDISILQSNVKAKLD